MKRQLFISLIILLIPAALVSQTIIGGGNISGTWTAANSPYLIQGNCSIIDLTIEPGVEIQFEGDYNFEVSWRLYAVGFHSDSIIFRASSDNTQGWKGIKFKASLVTSSLSYCRIEGSSDKGAIQVENESPILSHCDLINNAADGLYLKDASVEIHHFVINNNTENGVVLDGGALTANNIIIANNTIDGITSTHNDDGATLTNSVIANNGGDGFLVTNGSVAIENSIIYGNQNSINGTIQAAYSCIETASVYPGTGNINTNPQFKNSLYELDAESPCIDAGTTNILQSDRFFPPSLGGARNDMGAYGGPGAGEWYPPLYIVPQSVDFGQVTLDSSASITLDVYNYRDAEIAATVIVFVPGTPNVFSTVPFSFNVSVSSSEQVVLTFTPNAVQDFSADMVILTLDRGTVSIPVQGEGVVADIDLLVSQLVFGDVLASDSSVLFIPFRNTGNDSLRINVDAPLETVFTIDQSQFVIGPSGASDSIGVKFKPILIANYQDSVIINSNDPDENPLSVQISGRGTGSQIAVTPDTINYDSVSIGSFTERSLMLSNTGNVDLIINEIESGNPLFDVRDSLLTYPFRIEPDSSLELVIRFTPMVIGHVNTHIVINSNSIEYDVYNVYVNGTGTGPLLVFSSNLLDFGTIPLLADSVRELGIQNSGNVVANIQDIVLNNITNDSIFSVIDPDSVTPFSLQPDQDTTLSIRFEAKTVGTDSGRLAVLWGNPDTETSVTLVGTGQAPVLILFTDSLDYGDVNIPFDSVQTLIIRNTGNQDLSIQTLEFSGQTPDSMVFDTVNTATALPFTILPESNFNLDLRFQPMREGYITTDLLMSSNDPRSPFVSVVLSGNGLLPPLLLSDAKLEYGSVRLYTESEKSISLTNKGQTTISILDLNLIQDGSDYQLVDSAFTLPIVLAPDEMTELTVLFAPLSRGSISGQLIISTNIPAQPTIALDLAGVGIAAQISYLPATLNFGTVLTSNERIRELTISNSGNDTLIVSQLQFIDQPQDSIVFDTLSADLPLFILPDSSTKIWLVFRPIRDGFVTRVLEISSNDPDSSVVGVMLSGTGIESAPILSLSDEDLDFGDTQVSATSIAELLITNTGNQELIVTNLEITDSNPDTVFGMLPVVDVPFNLQPDSSRILTLQFTPNRVESENGLLVISSNDPIHSQDTVSLNGTGTEAMPAIELSALNHNFERTLVTENLQHIIYVYNRGFADLVIPTDSIYLESGTNQPFSLTDLPSSPIISPADSDSIIIRFQPESSGLFEDVLRIVSNDPENSIQTISLAGTGYINETASIVFDPLLSSNSFIKNQPATISFIINNVAVIDSALIYTREGGEETFSAYPLVPHVNEQNWYLQISANQITERGFEYYVSVAHSQNITLYPESGSYFPASIEVIIPIQQFPQQTKQEIYQMVSIPFSTGGSDMASTTMFGDDLGAYDDTKYRVFEVLNGASYSELRNMNKPLPAGKSVWLITKDPVSLDVSNGTSVQTNTDFELILEQGWNLIATPFAFPVSWSSVTSQFALRYYSGSDWEFATVLAPYTGYAVYVPGDTVLLIPPVAAPLQKTESSKQEGWQIQISARSDQFSDTYNYAGARPIAADGINLYNHRDPLPIGDHVSLYLLSGNSTVPYSTLFKEQGQDGYRFDFELTSTISAAKSIDFYPTNIPYHLDWVVISAETNTNYGQQPIEVSSNSARFQIIVGTPEYLEDIVLSLGSPPREFGLSQNFPNPFNPITSIEYSIPKAARIFVSVHNILGQKIKTLLSGVNKEAGTYRLTWNGRNSSGKQVASGIYVLYFRSDEYQRSIKMILQR